MTLTDTAPALISTKAAVAVAELTLASLRNELENAFGDRAQEVQEKITCVHGVQEKVACMENAIGNLKQAIVWLQLAQPEVKT